MGEMKFRKSPRTFHLNPQPSDVADVSETGVRFVLQKGFKMGELVSVEISSQSQKLALKGKIMRSMAVPGGKFDTGVHFTDLNSEKEKTLKLMIEAYGRGVPIQVQLLA